MTRYYCTYFDRKYLTRGMALIESLRRTESSDWEIFVVCMDEMTRVVLRALALPNVHLIPLHEIESRDQDLLAVKPMRTLVEYYWTMTPTVVLRILERNPTVNQLTYVDSDLLFFSSPQPMFDELGAKSILIHEHRFSPAQAHLGVGNGTYNVGLLSFNRTATSFEALRWWRARCLEWCFARTENGKMGDQMYLNDWPERFKDVVVLDHCGGGVGPWNHDRYRFRKDDKGVVWVNDVPVIFYHFHSFTQVTADVALPVKHPHYPLPWPTLSLFFVPYLSALEQAEQQVATVFPQGLWHLSPEQPVTGQHTVLIRAKTQEYVETLQLSHERVSVDDEWDCLYPNQIIRRQESYERRHPGASAKASVESVRADELSPSSTGGVARNQKAPIEEQVFVGDSCQFYASVGKMIQACEDLSAALAQSSSDPVRLTQVLTDWAQVHSPDPMLRSVIGQLQRQDPRLLAFLPQRLQLALGYVTRPFHELIAWLGTSKETTNLTYDLTPANSLHLAWMLSLVTSAPLPTIRGFLAELEQEVALKNHVRTVTATSAKRLTADAEARYGRRAGWYALVRTLKPKVVVETGVDKGLGTCILAAALLKNRDEGHEGRLYATDIDPTAGFLFTSPYDQVGKIIYGDSITTLRGLSESIDLFIADSAHTAEYERGEYETVLNRLSPHAVVVSDNAHVTQELAQFAERTGRQFLYFQEQPQAHFYPGAGMGIAYHTSSVTRRSPTEHGDGHSQTCSPPPHVRSIDDERAMPLVSVLVSAYESEAFMQECLEDLVGQTIADQMEIIVVDAASPQDEGRIVKAFQQRYHNIEYIRTPNRIGVYAAWNIAVKRARGRYITPFSTNDRLRPDAYEILANSLDKYPAVSLVYGDTYLTDLPHQAFEHHRRVGVWSWPEYSYEYLLKHCTIGPHPMWRRTLHETVGYFDESYIALGDQDFWIRVGAQHHMLHIPVVTGLYWRSPDGLSNRAEIAVPEQQRLRATYPKDCSGSATEMVDPSGSRYDCSVIIPVWNRYELTRQCLEALAKTTVGLSWELIVIDNHSTDETASFLSTLGGDVQIITNEENRGFAKACNQGARAARGKYLVFLNNDTIPQADWLKPLLREVEEHPEVGIVGSKLLYQDGTVQHAGVVLDRSDRFPYHIYRGFSGDSLAVNQRREYQVVTAACLLIRQSLFRELGGFDEGFCNGFEDVDLCLKAGERGSLVVYQPRSVLYHLESQTPGRKQHDQANAIRLYERWKLHWWLADEDLRSHIDGYKHVMTEIEGRCVASIQLLEDIKDRAAWAHVAATQAAALKKDWAAVRWELQMVEDWPSDRFVLSWAATVCEHLQEPAVQLKFLTRYLELHDDQPVRLRVIRALLEQRDLGAADWHLQRLLADSPTHAEGLLLNGILGMQREQYEQAEAAFSSALHEGADRKKCLMGMGMAAMGMAYTQGAWEHFLQVLAEHPDDATAIHWLLRAGTAQNRWHELSERLQAYVTRNPGDVATRLAFAGVLLRDDQVEAARREHDALRQVAPHHDGLAQLGQAIAGREAALAFEAASS